jgi:RNA polymerase primary sigma factor
MSFLRDPVPLWEMDSVAEAHTWIPEHDLEGAELMEVIDTLLATLGEREAKILRLYHGLDGTETMTLEEIGSQLGVTRERVRQIKEKAMEKLLARGAAKLLSQYH